MRKPRVMVVVGAMAAAGALAGGVASAVGGSNDDSPGEQRAEEAFTAAHRDEVAVSRAEAEATAREATPGTVIHAELEAEGGTFVWEIEIEDGRALHEVTVDAETGDVLGTETEGDEGEDR
jgi:uncharacterized membrane protein YkoI